MYKILYFLLLSINLLNALPAYDEKSLLEHCSMTCSINPLWTHQLNKLGIDKHFTPNNDSTIFQQSLLHEHYPLLNNNIPYISFAQLPTPIERLDIGCVKQQLYIKRDDLTGYSSETYFYGGNKVRKLEFLLADALYHNAQSVMTFGCTGSNHALATSVYAKALGLECSIFVTPQKNS